MKKMIDSKDATHFPGEPVNVFVVDFDKTFIRENLLVAWVFFILLKSNMDFPQKLLFLLKSFSRGLASFVLSHHSGTAELAVKIAYRTFRDIPAVNIHDFIMNKSSWKGGFAINLNDELIRVLQRLIRTTRKTIASKPKIVITSQGSFSLAIRTFLTRQDVVESMRKAGICIDQADSDSVIANNLEAMNGRFTGKLIPPLITKYNRLLTFPDKAVFVGDSGDELALRAEEKNKVRFIHYRKISGTDER